MTNPRNHRWAIGLGLFLAAAGCAGCSQVRPDEPLVDVTRVDPRIVVDIKYATADNFMHRPLYPVNRCLLRESVARRLSKVQDDLASHGYGLKIYDGYRPLSVQKLMWQVLPDERYVANPAKGSRHNRGAAVDVTLIDAQGRELPMPSPYDEFSERAHRTYAGGTEQSRRHRDLLIHAMERRGFTGLDTEWWHFDAPGWKQYPVMDVGLEEANQLEDTAEPAVRTIGTSPSRRPISSTAGRSSPPHRRSHLLQPAASRKPTWTSPTSREVRGERLVVSG